MMDNYRVPASLCPGCGNANDGATGIIGMGSPEPGDVTVCAYCGMVLVFTDTLRTRILSNEEWAGLPDAQKLAITAARKAVASVSKPRA